MNKKKEFETICNNIKKIKIQGAENVAKSAFHAYKLFPTKRSKKILLSLRPTEPMLTNLLNNYNFLTEKELFKKLEENQIKINKAVLKLVKKNSIIFTHCHSSSVIKSLIYAKNKGRKNFEVYNTETRPLFQGRKTLLELKKQKIKVTMFVDSAIKIALTKDQDFEENTKPVDFILLGADAITKKGIINKVGSGMISDIARQNKIPLYIVADSLKFTKKKIKLEQRSPKEVWNKKNINIKDPAFEFVPKKNITGIVSEFGLLKFDDFLKKF